jgi:uncharacterized protein (TIGR03437 family)
MLLAAAASAQPKRVLYVTHSAGFRHSSIEVSREVLQAVAAASGSLEVVATEDLSSISRDNLSGYEAVLFFTSGELALSAEQKQALLDFVRGGKGFAGVHSATDTLYSWPEYGEMIGAYFDGHPWVHEAGIDIEDPKHPIVAHLGTSFRMVEEFYQFRSFSRDRVRVLMTLDSRSIDLNAPGVNRTDRDFALAWTRQYGEGRVFYTALGHFDETWRDERFQVMMRQALLWLTRQIEAAAEPRTAAPQVSRIAEPAEGTVAPGAIITVEGIGLTTGSSAYATSFPLPLRLAGSEVHLEGNPVPLIDVSPERIRAQAPYTLSPGSDVRLEVLGGGVVRSQPQQISVQAAAPLIVAAVRDPEAGVVILYATGLGSVAQDIPAGAAAPSDPLATLKEPVLVRMNGIDLPVLYAGLAPGLAGIYQVNAELKPDATTGEVLIETQGRASNRIEVR